MLIRNFSHSLLLVVLCGLGGAFSAAAQNAASDNVSLTIPQARQVAANALRRNQPRFALQIADGLLQRDPKDAFAHFLIAKAALQLDKPRDGRRAAVRSFRFSKTDRDKFTSSQLAAQLAYQEKRLTLAQVWLRRSVNFVQTPQQRQQVAKDYQRLRSENPWNTQLQFSVAPSSNVNGGSDGILSIIDGVPAVGLISRDARALSGTAAVADLSTRYRFSTNAKHAAYLTGRLYTRQVNLSSKAQREAPSVQNRDFSATTAEVGVKYVFRSGKRRGLSTINANIGKNWYGGNPKSTFARVGYEYSFLANKRTRVTFSGSHERRNYDAVWNKPTTMSSLRGNLRYKFENGGAIGFGAIATKTSSDTVNLASNSATVYMSYEMAEPVGPAALSFNFGATHYDFPTFGFGFFSVPGGRQDTSVFANVVMAFEKIDYAGFTPTLTLRAQQNRSNISNLNSTQLSAGFGIKSSF